MDAIAKIFEIRQCAIDGRPIPDSMAPLLLDILSGKIDLPNRYRLLKMQRDWHLRAAFELLPDHLSEWQKCRLLAAGVELFESELWQDCQFDREPPSQLNDVQVHVWFALKTGLKPPLTGQGISDIVRVKEVADFLDNPLDTMESSI